MNPTPPILSKNVVVTWCFNSERWTSRYNVDAAKVLAKIWYPTIRRFHKGSILIAASPNILRKLKQSSPQLLRACEIQPYPFGSKENLDVEKWQSTRQLLRAHSLISEDRVLLVDLDVITLRDLLDVFELPTPCMLFEACLRPEILTAYSKVIPRLRSKSWLVKVLSEQRSYFLNAERYFGNLGFTLLSVSDFWLLDMVTYLVERLYDQAPAQLRSSARKGIENFEFWLSMCAEVLTYPIFQMTRKYCIEGDHFLDFISPERNRELLKKRSFTDRLKMIQDLGAPHHVIHAIGDSKKLLHLFADVSCGPEPGAVRKYN